MVRNYISVSRQNRIWANSLIWLGTQHSWWMRSCAYLLILKKLGKTIIMNKSVKRDTLTFKLHWFVCVCVYVHAQLCLTLCDLMDCSLPSSSIHGIFQARILEWVVISYCKGYSWPRDQTCVSCIGRQILYHCATWEVFICSFPY